MEKSGFRVAVVMGSASDADALKPCFKTLEEYGIPFDVRIISAHRTPGAAFSFSSGARDAGYGVIIAAAGKAAHLAGAIAANTTLPVIGIPMKSSELDGLDALLSTVQMPSGVPVATVAINGAKNAALLAVQILAVSDGALAARLAGAKEEMRRETEAKDARAAELAGLC
ncbi:MAG: 5-(carboxyamino)imidazole ribonucleotide mutase [Clostridiales bacterium]|nr:5-(carboxyamino)imidazole ribonucleotide mutase [Clostridiales bacterium]